MKLSNHINNFKIAHNLEKFNQFLDEGKIKCEVSFWATKSIKIEGYEGSVSIRKLKQKVCQAALQRFNADNLSDKEREAGVDIYRKLEKYTQISDEIVAKKNCLTRLIDKIKEQIFSDFVTRIPDTPCFFMAYNEQAFRQKYGPVKNSFGSSNIMTKMENDEGKMMYVPRECHWPQASTRSGSA